MLSWSCRRFRKELGAGHPHRRTCPECAAFAAALEKTAAARLPLPERLRSGLRAIPAGEGRGPRLPVPALPMPPHLRARLRELPQILRQGAAAGEPPPRELPAWVRSSRYAVAASYLLAVLVVHLLGDPLALGRQAAGSLSQELRQVWERTGAEVGEPLERLERLENGVTERYGATREALETSIAGLRSRVNEMTRELFPG